MAKAAWLTVEPQSGQGNATVQNTGTVHTGRVQRTTTVTGVATGVKAAKSYQVSQEPKPVFLSVNTKTFSVGENSTTITVSGTSNATSIGLSAVSGSGITFTFPETLRVGPIDVATGSAIPNDPGASAEYSWLAVVTVPKSTVGQRTGKFNVTAEGCDPIEISVTQAASTYSVTYSKGSYINTISKTSETVDYGGTATCTATLPSNTAQYTYAFDGWYEGSSKISSNLALSVSNITKNRTFTATGTRTLNRYTMTITVTPTGGGTVSGGGTYAYGSSVTLTATPATGYDFVKFVDEEGDEYTANPSSGWQITKNRTVQAVFALKQYIITYAKTTGIASISRASETVNYGSNAQGSTAILTTGYEFSGWYNSDNTRVSTSLTYAPTNVTASATYEARATIKTFTVTVNAYYRDTDGTGDYTSGTTGGTVSGGGTVNYGSDKTVTASAATGYTFDGWYSAGTSGGTLLSSSASYSIENITANQTVYARFTKKYYTITYEKGDYINTVSRASERVAYGGTAVGCTATPNTTTAQYSYLFSGWYNASGTRVSTTATYAPTNVTANATYTAKATRTLRSYTISVSANPSNRATVSGGGTYDYGDTVTVSCTKKNLADAFGGWYEGSSKVSTSTSYQFTCTGARTLQAKIYYLTVSPTSLSFGNGSSKKTFTIISNVDWELS